MKIQSPAMPNYYVRGLEKYLLIRWGTDFVSDVNPLLAFEKILFIMKIVARLCVNKLRLFFPLFSPGIFDCSKYLSIEKIVDIKAM